VFQRKREEEKNREAAKTESKKEDAGVWFLSWSQNTDWLLLVACLLLTFFISLHISAQTRISINGAPPSSY
jgi:hypothetical protein